MPFSGGDGQQTSACAAITKGVAGMGSKSGWVFLSFQNPGEFSFYLQNPGEFSFLFRISLVYTLFHVSVVKKDPICILQLPMIEYIVVKDIDLFSPSKWVSIKHSVKESPR